MRIRGGYLASLLVYTILILAITGYTFASLYSEFQNPVADETKIEIDSDKVFEVKIIITQSVPNQFSPRYLGKYENKLWYINSSQPISVGDTVSKARLIDLKRFAVSSEGYESYAYKNGIEGAITIEVFSTLSDCYLECRIYQIRNQVSRYIEYQNSVSACSKWFGVPELLTEGQCGDVAGFMSGLVTGNTTMISKPTKDLFRNFGLSHILAVSGFQVTLITSWIELFLLQSRLPRNVRIAAGIILICCYGFLVGFQPPIVRAIISSIIASIILVALGRKVAGWRILILTAILMILYNPFYLLNMSFQLSFIASFVLTLWPNSEKPNFLQNILSSSAQTLTIVVAILPISLGISSEINPASLLVNTLIAPIIPISTIGVIITSLNFPIISDLVGLITVTVISGILLLVNSLNQDVPTFSIQSFSTQEILIYYGVLGVCIPIIALIQQKTKINQPEKEVNQMIKEEGQSFFEKTKSE